VSREEALELIKANIKKENLIKHMLAVEAIMKAIAEVLNEDKEKWGLLGLLHDIDFDKTFDNPKKHAMIAVEILSGKVDEEMLRAIKSHNFENTDVTPESKMEFALIAADAISGLVIACALVVPSKKLSDVKAESVARRFKEKDFARNCNRERIYMCEKIGIDRKKFAEIALQALQSISNDLGL
jgi:putative nucleotidyltransferase with HDIG domain